jgi:tRNA dimethylallyltransferase
LEFIWSLGFGIWNFAPRTLFSLMSAPIFLAGPTASGKSAVALALAEKVGGEIISVDSMQVYRGLDIGTAKPSAEECARVPHHLIDAVELTESFDAANFVALARRAEQDIRARGRVPIFCGGTGLYFKAYLEGLGDAPAPNAALRQQLERTPLDQLLAELQQRDPPTYERIDKQNPRRVIRAVEVIRLTGKRFSERAEWQRFGSSRGHEAHSARSALRAPHSALDQSLLTSTATIFGLQRAPADLHARIAARVDEMFARGIVEETRELLKCGLEQNRTALQSLGYRQVVEYLRGERSLAEAIELVKIKTRQFSKRQMTWFRRQLEVCWISVDAKSTAVEVAEAIARKL